MAKFFYLEYNSPKGKQNTTVSIIPVKWVPGFSSKRQINYPILFTLNVISNSKYGTTLTRIYNNKAITSEKNINPSRPDHGRREKINLNFYFHTSLWCLKRFYESLLRPSENLLRHHKEV